LYHLLQVVFVSAVGFELHTSDSSLHRAMALSIEKRHRLLLLLLCVRLCVCVC
jgi:hypothetical protein